MESCSLHPPSWVEGAEAVSALSGNDPLLALMAHIAPDAWDCPVRYQAAANCPG